MKKLVLSLLLLLVVAVGVGAILYFGGFLKAPEIRSLQMEWGEVTLEATQVKAEVVVNNPLPIGVGSSNVSLEVPVDFYEATAFFLEARELALEKGESTVPLNGTLEHADLPLWWPQFINNQETLVMRARPRVRTRVLGRELSTELPRITEEHQIELLGNMRSNQPVTVGFDVALLDLVRVMLDPRDSLKAHFVVNPPPSGFPILTLESWEMRWGDVTPETTHLVGTMVLRNETAIPLPIQGLRLGINMNEIAMTPDTEIVPDQPLLPPKGVARLSADLPVENAKLIAWWTSHLQRGEKTALTARLSMIVVLSKDVLASFIGTFPGAGELLRGLPESVSLPFILIPGFTCNISTDILGAINQRIAEALEIDAAPEPEPAAVDCPTPALPALAE